MAAKHGKIHLSFAQQLEVANYMRKNHESFSGKTADEVAKEVSQAVKFNVTPVKISSLARNLGIKWYRPRGPGKRLTKPSTKKISENHVIRIQLRTIGKIQQKLIEEFGVKINPEQREILARIVQYGADV